MGTSQTVLYFLETFMHCIAKYAEIEIKCAMLIRLMYGENNTFPTRKLMGGQMFFVLEKTIFLYFTQVY